MKSGRRNGQTFKVGSLNGTLSFPWSAERPRAGGATYLHLAGARQAHFREFTGPKLWRWQ
jgi:hypothetical protein